MKSAGDLLIGILTVKRPALFAFLVAGLFMVLTQLLALQSYLLRKNLEKEEIAREISLIKDRFQVLLKHNLSAAKTLAFIVKKYGVPDDFESVAGAIVDSNKGIDAIELTNKGIITHVYPFNTHRSVIGYDILTNPKTNKEAKTAIKKNELFFAGPLKLKQGGVGIVGRLPIFIKGEFYGFSAVIIRLETFINALGIDSLAKGPFIYQLSKINPNTQVEEFFLQNPIQLNSHETLSITIPDGNWKIYIMRKADSGNFSFISFSALGILLSIVCGLFAWFVARQPKKLEELVRYKTEHIKAIENNNKTTLERVSDAVIALDNDWRYTYLNDAALIQHPGGRDATLGRVIWDIHPELKDSLFWEKYHEAMETKRVVEIEEYYEPLKAWFVVKVYPSENGLTLFYRDITLQKIAEQELLIQKSLSESIINSLPGIFYLYDRNQKFLKWNRNFEVVSGYSAEEISKMKALDFFDVDEKKLLQNRIDTVFKTGKADVEAHFLTKDKRKIPFYFNGHLCSFNGTDYLIGVGINIAERLAAEQEKEKITYDLIQRYKNMEEFSYIVSHNIRAPVANLLGLSELLKIGATNPDDTSRIMNGFSTAVCRLDEVIKDLNEILSVRTQVFAEKELVYFKALVDNILHNLESVIRDQNIEVVTNFESVEKFNTVKVYLNSIFYNLISNSVKFRRKDTALKIEIESQRMPHGFRLIFRDNGMGIDLEKYMGSVFGLYKRFHLHIDGKGLGLFMVRTQVEALGGKIFVNSELNRYTEFVIEFSTTP